MKNLLIVGIAAVVLFALSAALSLYLASLNKPADKGDAVAKGKEKDKKGKGEDEPPAPLVGEPTPKAAEEAAQLLSRLRQRSADLQKREEEARKQEQRLQIVMDDVRGERAVIDTLRKQLSTELGRLDEKREGVEKKARSLEEQKRAAEKLLADLEKRQITLEKNEGKNLTQMASISDSMPPEKAARILKQMADTGEMDTAVKLLGQMRERRAAAVLAEVTDVTLAAQFLEKLRGLKRPAPAPAGGGP